MSAGYQDRRALEDLAQHPSIKFSRGRVLLAGMIRRDHNGIECVFDIVPERKRPAGGDDPAILQNGQVRIERELAESNHHSHIS